MTKNKIPVNVFTGFIGAGKTTIIMHLLQHLPSPEKVVWLKNEYGDVNIDKLLVQSTNVKTAEILNGCICCVLVGRLESALIEIVAKYAPSRIIIESSGTAHPGPIAREVLKNKDLYLDGVVTIIDVLNYSALEEGGKLMAEMEAGKYTNLIVLNKYPKEGDLSVNQQIKLERTLEPVYDMYLDIPKLMSVTGEVPVSDLIGLAPVTLEEEPLSKNDEADDHDHWQPDVVVLQYPASKNFDMVKIATTLTSLPKSVYRYKGVVKIDNNWQIFNGVNGSIAWSYGVTAQESELVFFGANIEKERVNLQKLIDATTV